MWKGGEILKHCKPSECLLCNPEIIHVKVPRDPNKPPILGGIWIRINEEGDKKLFKPNEICYDCFIYHYNYYLERFLLNRKQIKDFREELA